MPIYKKRPVPVEAHRWTGTVESAGEIIKWAMRFGGNIEYVPSQDAYDDGVQGCPYVPAHLVIHTLEGPMHYKAGDFVIRGVENEFYACDSAIFEKTYEPAE